MKLNLNKIKTEKLKPWMGITYILVHARVNRRTGEIVEDGNFTLLKQYNEIEKGKHYLKYSVEIVGSEEGCRRYFVEATK